MFVFSVGTADLCNISPTLKFLTVLTFLIAINCLTRSLTHQFYSTDKNNILYKRWKICPVAYL